MTGREPGYNESDADEDEDLLGGNETHIRGRVIGTVGAIEVGLRSRNVSVRCNTERV